MPKNSLEEIIKEMKKQKGYTLAELMVTVAIIIILAGLALPNFVEFIADQRLKQAADTTASIMRRAQAKAIEVSSTVTVTVNSNMAYVTGYSVSAFNFTMPENTVATGDTSIIFAPDGRASASGSVLFNSSISKSVRQRGVTVTPLGQIIVDY